MKRLAILTSCALMSAVLSAQTAVNDSISSDSVKSQQLNEVVVESRNSRLGAEVSTFIPTSRQKTSAQNATDLLNRMAIPQLSISLGNTITDISGKPVDVFIDYMPASNQDLSGMKTTDVKRVEYYDFPTDPCFMGKAHVINFVMQQYEYEGYVKPYLESCTSAGTAQWALFNRLQYRRMTFDFALNGFHKDQDHIGSDMSETFRLPQRDGSTNVIEKQSSINSGRLLQRDHYAYFKTKYNSEKLSMQHDVMLTLKRQPRNDQSGTVLYSDSLYDATSYVSESSNRANSIKYDGYVFYKFNANNTLTLDPQYAYSHTNTSSLYYEQGGHASSVHIQGGQVSCLQCITQAGNRQSRFALQRTVPTLYFNGARDNTHEFMVPVSYDHSFGDWGDLHVHFRNYYSTSETQYTGTAESVDNSDQLDIIFGARYTLSKGKFYGYFGTGYYWDKTSYGSLSVKSHSPWADFSLQYSPNDRHTAKLEYHHMSSCPEPNYFSDNVIHKGPLMSITGNLSLKPYHCNDLSLSYTFVPNNKFSLSTFAYLSTVDNRHVVDYTATPTGILRKVIQPSGSYNQLDYGVSGSARLLKNKLQLTASVYGTTWHNGKPYNQDETKFFYYLQAFYYLGNWNFGALYYSKRTYSDGFTSGTIITSRPKCYLSAGWSNAKWNVRAIVYDFTKWNWKSDISEMHSPYYDSITQAYSQGDHCLVKLTASYTFSFGKKVERGSDSIQRGSVSSSILK